MKGQKKYTVRIATMVVREVVVTTCRPNMACFYARMMKPSLSDTVSVDVLSCDVVDEIDINRGK